MLDPDSAALRGAAEKYLADQLEQRAGSPLAHEGDFAEAPLAGEGPTTLFSFELTTPKSGDSSSAAPHKHYVAVGQTTPSFFPAYGLDSDDAYSFHIGTRFMLEMKIGLVDASLEPPAARGAMRGFVASYARERKVESERLAALFRCDDQYFAVYRLTLDGEDVYCLGADCPPGFYRLAQHPPQVALRLHLGKLIRVEARRSP